MAPIEIPPYTEIAAFAVFLFLLKKAFFGSQPIFARIALGLILGGFGLLSLVQVQGDSISWAGAIVMGAGLLMAMLDVRWTWSNGVRRSQG